MRARQRLRLAPVDRLQDGPVEVLHAEADAVEAELAQQPHLLGRGDDGVDLEGDLGAGREDEAVAQHRHQAAQARLVEVVGRAAAPVQLGDAPTRAEPIGHQVDLPLQPVEVRVGGFAPSRDDHVAAAEGAALLAERHVDVERQRPVGGGRGGRAARRRSRRARSRRATRGRSDSWCSAARAGRTSATRSNRRSSIAPSSMSSAATGNRAPPRRRPTRSRAGCPAARRAPG